MINRAWLEGIRQGRGDFDELSPGCRPGPGRHGPALWLFGFDRGWLSVYSGAMRKSLIRWGIIGCGDVAEIKSGPGLQKARGSALVAVMRRDGAKAADYARRHGVGKWYDDAAKLVGDREIDAIYVATPPAQHEFYALMARDAGKPCYVEKPMARCAAEAGRMMEAFGERKLPLFVAFYRRALPRFVKVKEIIEGGELGVITSASYTFRDNQMATRTDPVPWRFDAGQAGGGLFVDMGCHALDLLDFFLGPLSDVVGKADNKAGQFDVEDFVELTFTAAGGISGKALFDFASDQQEDRFVLRGDKGAIEFSCGTEGPLLVQINGRPPEAVNVGTVPHVQQPLIQAVVDVLLGDSAPPAWISTGAVGLRTQQVMDQALVHFYGDRENGFWKRSRR